MKDWEIQTDVVPGTAVSGTDNIARIAENPNREAIMVGNPTGATVPVTFREAPTAANGLPLTAAAGFILFTYSQVGSGVQQAVNVLCAAPGVSIPYIEFHRKL